MADNPVVAVITFGQLRTGDRNLEEAYLTDHRLWGKHLFGTTNVDDPVTLFPAYAWGFRNNGHEIINTKGYD